MPSKSAKQPNADYLTERQLCSRYHISQRTAQRWRLIGEGPPFIRFGLRRVIYRLADCEAWVSARIHIGATGSNVAKKRRR